MNIIVIIVLTVILILTFNLVTLLLVLLQKHHKNAFTNFAADLNNITKNLRLNKIDSKHLPVKITEIEKDIYFATKVVIGKYNNPERIINEKNTELTNLLKDYKLKVFYHYKLINLGNSKFLPLNKIDIFLSKRNINLYYPLERKVIAIDKIKDITIFWEKNVLIQRKDFFPGVRFNYQHQNYFLLFQTYNEVLKFISYLNLIY